MYKLSLKIIAVVISIIAVINISNFQIELGVYYYFILAIILLVLLLFSKNIKINYLVFWLVGASFISIIFIRVPIIFNPYLRFVAFVVLISLIGPFLSSKTLTYVRIQVFSSLNRLIVIMVFMSFIGLLLNLQMVFGRSGFTGFFNHSMVLGPMAAISLLASIKNAYLSKNLLRRLFYFILIYISFVTCIAAGSRAALISVLAGILFFVYKINQNRLTRFLRFVIIIGSVLILSYPLWEQYSDRIILKMSYAEERGDLTITRTALWGLRLEEFSSSPIIGVGFASVDISLPGNRFDPFEGKVEPGSSWLAGLSMIGLLGFFPFLILVYGYMKFIIKNKEAILQSAYLGSLIVLFFFHMIAEGYIFSAGSGLFFYFWLILGVIDQLKLTTESSDPFKK